MQGQDGGDYISLYEKQKRRDKDTFIPSVFSLLGHAPLRVATGFPDNNETS